MKSGLVYIAFGRNYDNFAAHTIAYSRRFTNLPICVFTNLDENQRSPKWNVVEGIIFNYIQKPVAFNRNIKTRMFEYSPFDLSLYLDCDCVIQRRGIENLFDFSNDFDVRFCIDLEWFRENKVLNIYREAMKRTGVGLPITIYHGGFQLFRKNQRVARFYYLWNQYWKMNGRGRDMPALNCAVPNSEVRVSKIKITDDIYSSESKQERVIIQHRYTGDFCKKFSLPEYKPWKPFDTAIDDFSWVVF